MSHFRDSTDINWLTDVPKRLDIHTLSDIVNYLWVSDGAARPS